MKKKIEFHLVMCKRKLHFSDDITIVKNDKNYWLPVSRVDDCERFILPKIDALKRTAGLISHVSETTFTFMSILDKITYGYFLTIPNPMIEWRFNILLSRNPKIVRIFKNSAHPLIRKYNHISIDVHDDEQ